MERNFGIDQIDFRYSTLWNFESGLSFIKEFCGPTQNWASNSNSPVNP